MVNDQSRVLKMLAEGKISVEEAERLLAAITGRNMGEPGSSPNSGADRERQRVAVRVDSAADRASSSTRDDTFVVGDSPKLVVNAKNGRINVNAGPDHEVRVQATLKNASEDDYEVSQEGDVIHVKAKEKEHGPFGLFGLRHSHIHVSATVPRNTEVELKSVNGSVEAYGVEGGGKLRSTNGKIALDEATGDFDLTTVNGSINLARAKGASRLRSTNGSITVSDASGAFDAKTVNGKVSLTAELTAGGENDLKTTNGSIRVGLIGAPSLRIDAASRLGSVRHNLPTLDGAIKSKKRLPGEKLTGTIGDGEATLNIGTTSGSITIERPSCERG